MPELFAVGHKSSDNITIDRFLIEEKPIKSHFQLILAEVSIYIYRTFNICNGEHVRLMCLQLGFRGIDER